MKNNRRCLAFAALCLVLVLLVGTVGCKAQEDISNVPTPKPEKQTVVVNNEVQEPEHYIEVVGNGEIIASPDFATITLGVAVRGDTAETASAACQEEVKKAIAAATGLEIARDQIALRGVEIEPKLKANSEAISHYIATDVVTITIKRVAQAESLMTAVMDAGSFELRSITYSLTESSEAYRSALVAATEDAFAKATVLAEATGAKLGKVIGITETAYDDRSLIGENFESSAIAVSAQITVQYEID